MYRGLRAVIPGAVFAWLMIASGTACATSLTGVVLFGADSSGAATGGYWNTLGGDAAFNLYLVQAGSPFMNPTFLNTGNGAQARIDITLTPGSTYSFGYLATSDPPASGVPEHGFFGLNFFFNNDDVRPQISAYAASSTSLFAADSAGSTPRLDTTSTGGSGTLLFTDGAAEVRLTTFVSAVTLSDLVSGYATGGDQRPDYAGSFTLAVTAVPEPRTLVSCILALTFGVAGFFCSSAKSAK